MPIRFNCPNCKIKAKAPDGAAGKTTKCPNCSKPIVIPAHIQSRPPEPPAQNPILVPADLPDAPVVRQAMSRIHPTKERPRQIPVWIWAFPILGFIGCMFAGLFVLFVFLSESRPAVQKRSTPKQANNINNRHRLTKEQMRRIIEVGEQSLLPLDINKKSEQRIEPLDFNQFEIKPRGSGVGFPQTKVKPDIALGAYVRARPANPTKLAVWVFLSDYYGGKFTEKEYFSLSIVDDERRNNMFGFVTRDSQTAKALLDLCKDGKERKALIELRNPHHLWDSRRVKDVNLCTITTFYGVPCQASDGRPENVVHNNLLPIRRKFRSLQKGMSMAEVKSLLGEPTRVEWDTTPVNRDPVWRYQYRSSDPNDLTTRLPGFPPPPDLGGSSGYPPLPGVGNSPPTSITSIGSVFFDSKQRLSKWDEP